MIIFKNLLSFGLTYKAYDWFVQSGVEDVMVPVASVQVVVCLTSVPMCKCKYMFLLLKHLTWMADFFGKRCRAFFHRHDLLALTRLR